MIKDGSYDQSPTEENKMALCNAQKTLNDKLEIEELFWRQKTNVKWLVEGDHNTKFFHQTVTQRKQKLHLHRIKNKEGIWLENIEDIKNEAICNFQSQLNGTHVSIGEDMLEHIPRMITEDQNDKLDAFPTMDEIHSTVLSMNSNSATGLNGFNGFFYKDCWETIKSDFTNAILDFFAGAEIPRSWSNTILVPVPKVHNPTSFQQLRPISLCNF